MKSPDSVLSAAVLPADSPTPPAALVSSRPSNTAGEALWWISLALGLLAVLWVAAGFVGNNPLALVMTLVIGAVYLGGALEVHRFRRATAGLAQALQRLPQPLAALGDWLPQVPEALQPAVRARIEGARTALPGLALAPYLIGLLVMLGMLGTFLGMVVTFKGAVFALEGSTDLQAIRSALAAPIRGLGLSFGTSVAGVATSAMLGLMAALARRERVAAVRALDRCMGGALRAFSSERQREQAFEALQQQAQTLPVVAQGLQAFMDQLEQRSQRLDEQLMARQAQFHSEAAAAYSALARSVEASLKDSLAASAQAASESLRPIVEAAMGGVAAESVRLHERVSSAVQAQLDGLSTRFAATADGVAQQWNAAVQQQAATSDRLVTGLERSLGGFTATFEARAAALLTGVQEQAARSDAAREQAAAAQLSALTQSLQALAADLGAQWQRAGDQALAQQRAVRESLEQTVLSITEHTDAQTRQNLEGVARLLAQSEALVQARSASEALWVQQQQERVDALLDQWREGLAALRTEEAARAQVVAERLAGLQADTAQQLQALRTEEAERGQAAVDRLGELQAVVSGQVSSHLATLGTALEAPMTRLIETASEAPRAAAEVIAQLRQEMGRLTERDNLALQERSELVEQISTLLQNVQHTTAEQRDAIEALVRSATEVLDRTGAQFAETLQAQASRADEQSVHLARSAGELAALGEAFQQGVERFSGSNEQLMESLQRVEAALSQSMARSDEQLAYYVAQAREVVDLSISAQQGIVEDLRQLRGQRMASVERTA